ncbi:response regulator transcription factor [Rheinheimera sp. UJ63]|uniref:response regulator transcription factor n=1 Tax=Rheinheimera sp. UJ63 TaxID=2910157 RepID=UPI001F260E42|nr:response regulator [Rheinheimera sp. UJ63]MCF4010530.1 response regulator [Rheinheimera sp. UJ63]
MIKKLVIVDDDPTLINTLARRLAKPGWQIQAFYQPLTEAELIAEQADIYLLDLRFGQQSGLSFIAPLRMALSHCRIIVLTGYASINTAVLAVKQGADDYLTKPVDFQLLQQTLFSDNLTEAEHTATPSNNLFLSPEQLEWEHIQRVLAKHDGNISQTAKSLGMHRRTLQRKLLKHRPT